MHNIILAATLLYAIINVYQLHKSNEELYDTTGNKFKSEKTLIYIFIFLAILELIVIKSVYFKQEILADNLTQIMFIIISMSNLLVAAKAKSIKNSISKLNKRIFEIQSKRKY